MFLLAVRAPLGIRRSLLCYLPVLICRDVFTPIWWGSFFRLLSVPNSEMKDRTSVPLCSSPIVREQSYFRTITEWLEITHDYQALKAILPPLSHIRIKTEKSSELAKGDLRLVLFNGFLALAFTVFSLVFLWLHLCTSFQSIPFTEWAKLHQIWCKEAVETLDATLQIWFSVFHRLCQDFVLLVKLEAKNSTSRQVFLFVQQSEIQST